jgi:hypothetical protein
VQHPAGVLVGVITVQHPAGVLVGRPDQVAIDTKPVAHRATSPPAEVQRWRYSPNGQGEQRSSRFWAFRSDRPLT